MLLEVARTFAPKPDFLQQGVRRPARDHGWVLIFDEVISGFRMTRGRAQQYYGVTFDMSGFCQTQP